MISVVIPAYNSENTIQKTIDSVLSQTFQDFELIVINDGCTDDTLRIVENIKDKRIKIFTINNSGVSVARNYGIKKAINKYVAFLDADDYWDKSFLFEISLLIDKYPKTKIFQTGRSLVYKDSVKRYNNPLLPKENCAGIIDYIEIIEAFEPPLHSSSVVADRGILLASKMFRENQKHYEDHDFWLRLCYNNEIAIVNKPLSFYRKDNENSATTKAIRVKDFLTYLNTISDVLTKVNTIERRVLLINFSIKLMFTIYNNNRSEFSKLEKKEILLIAEKLFKTRKLELLIFKTFVYTNAYILNRLIRKFIKMPPIY